VKVTVRETRFVGHRGQSVWLAAGDEYDHDDPIVKANPHMFTKPADEAPKRGGALRRG
jgi:hypothetical protein